MEKPEKQKCICNGLCDICLLHDKWQAYHEREVLRARIDGMEKVLVDMQESPAKEYHKERIATLTKKLEELNEERKN